MYGWGMDLLSSSKLHWVWSRSGATRLHDSPSQQTRRHAASWLSSCLFSLASALLWPANRQAQWDSGPPDGYVSGIHLWERVGTARIWKHLIRALKVSCRAFALCLSSLMAGLRILICSGAVTTRNSPAERFRRGAGTMVLMMQAKERGWGCRREDFLLRLKIKAWILHGLEPPTDTSNLLCALFWIAFPNIYEHIGLAGVLIWTVEWLTIDRSIDGLIDGLMDWLKAWIDVLLDRWMIN